MKHKKANDTRKDNGQMKRKYTFYANLCANVIVNEKNKNKKYNYFPLENLIILFSFFRICKDMKVYTFLLLFFHIRGAINIGTTITYKMKRAIIRKFLLYVLHI